jgi:NTP pyrophosphatase (non-canonical NTP hydrolase)
MIDLKKLQGEVWDNKLAQGFNVTDIPLEFSYTYGELAEAFEAYRKKKPDVGEELADVVIYILALSQMLGVDLEAELTAKIAKNARRKYEHVNGVHTRVHDG